MYMSKCRVVLRRFYFFVENQAEWSLANLPFHAIKTMKNDVCSTVPPDDQSCLPRRDALKGELQGSSKEQPRDLTKRPEANANSMDAKSVVQIRRRAGDHTVHSIVTVCTKA